jgi:hypothetical protein
MIDMMPIVLPVMEVDGGTTNAIVSTCMERMEQLDVPSIITELGFI